MWQKFTRKCKVSSTKKEYFYLLPLFLSLTLALSPPLTTPRWTNTIIEPTYLSGQFNLCDNSVLPGREHNTWKQVWRDEPVISCSSRHNLLNATSVRLTHTNKDKSIQSTTCLFVHHHTSAQMLTTTQKKDSSGACQCILLMCESTWHHRPSLFF